jgi:hypothetical protein
MTPPVPVGGAPPGQPATELKKDTSAAATAKELTQPPVPPTPPSGGLTLPPPPSPAGGTNAASDSMKVAQPPAAPTPEKGPPTPGSPASTNLTVVPTAVERASAQDQGGKNNVPTAPTPPMPPVGASPSAVSLPVQAPPPARAPVSAEPAVKVYDEQIYTCKPEDTSLEALSERIYKSKLYAQALLRFNREHPRGAEELRANPPQVRPGTQVHVPPLDVLESSYPDLFPGLKPLQPPPAARSVQVGQSSPVGLTDRVPVPVVAATQPVATTVPSVRVPVPGGQPNVLPANGAATGGKVYRVPAGGEHLYMIAQRTLGNGSRWTEIYRLNPQLNPEQPIPAGTPVVLPADARVSP